MEQFRGARGVLRIPPTHVDRPVYARRAGGNAERQQELPTKALIDQAKAGRSTRDAAMGSGWIAYAQWDASQSGTPLTSFTASWKVPPPPVTMSEQLIYLFNGITNYGSVVGILQPVLQWGLSATGGGPFWSVSSWYAVSNNQGFHTKAVRVEPGQLLTGAITMTGEYQGTYSYSSEFQGIDGTWLGVEMIPELLVCSVTLEAYDLTACSDYPDTGLTSFVSLKVETGVGVAPVNWTPLNPVQDCGQSAEIVNNSGDDGQVNIHYRA